MYIDHSIDHIYMYIPPPMHFINNIPYVFTDYTVQHAMAVDPFGHSPTMTYLLSQSGVTDMMIQRTHFAIKKHLATNKQLEFYWRQNWGKCMWNQLFCDCLLFHTGILVFQGFQWIFCPTEYTLTSIKKYIVLDFSKTKQFQSYFETNKIRVIFRQKFMLVLSWGSRWYPHKIV